MAYYRRHYGGQTAKYNNIKTVVDGITFDSRREANRYCELKLLVKGGLISNLELQKKYVLIEAQYAPDEVKTLKNGKQKIVKGELLERSCVYKADFTYIDNATGKTVVEDTKSIATRTPEYKIKKKLLLKLYGIHIVEI